MPYSLQDKKKVNLFLFKSLMREIPELRYLLFSKRIPLDSKLSTIKNVFSNYFGKLATKRKHQKLASNFRLAVNKL